MIGKMVDYIFKSSFSWFEVIAFILTFNLVVPPGVSFMDKWFELLLITIIVSSVQVYVQIIRGLDDDCKG